MNQKQYKPTIEDLALLGRGWEWMLTTGVLFIALGLFALSARFFGTMKVNNLLSLIFLAAGSFRLVEAFGLRNNLDINGRWFLSILSLVAGVLLFRFIQIGTIGIAAVLSFYFFIAAATQVMQFSILQNSSTLRWTIVSTTTSFALGVYIFFTFPFLVPFVPNLLLAIDLLAAGVSMIGLAYAVKKINFDYYATQKTQLTGFDRNEDYRKVAQTPKRQDDSATTRTNGP